MQFCCLPFIVGLVVVALDWLLLLVLQAAAAKRRRCIFMRKANENGANGLHDNSKMKIF